MDESRAWHKSLAMVTVVDHRDCGAVRLAYAAGSIATPAAETATHRKILAEFREAPRRAPPAARGRHLADGARRLARDAGLR
jgi:carbonic anhydrase